MLELIRSERHREADGCASRSTRHTRPRWHNRKYRDYRQRWGGEPCPSMILAADSSGEGAGRNPPRGCITTPPPLLVPRCFLELEEAKLRQTEHPTIGTRGRGRVPGVSASPFIQYIRDDSCAPALHIGLHAAAVVIKLVIKAGRIGVFHAALSNPCRPLPLPWPGQPAALSARLPPAVLDGCNMARICRNAAAAPRCSKCCAMYRPHNPTSPSCPAPLGTMPSLHQNCIPFARPHVRLPILSSMRMLSLPQKDPFHTSSSAFPAIWRKG